MMNEDFHNQDEQVVVVTPAYQTQRCKHTSTCIQTTNTLTHTRSSNMRDLLYIFFQVLLASVLKSKADLCGWA